MIYDDDDDDDDDDDNDVNATHIIFIGYTLGGEDKCVFQWKLDGAAAVDDVGNIAADKRTSKQPQSLSKLS